MTPHDGIWHDEVPAVIFNSKQSRTVLKLSSAVEVVRSLIFGAERIISEIQLKVGRTGEQRGAVERGEGWKSLNSEEVGQIHTNFSHLPFLLIQTKKKLKCQNQDDELIMF